MNAHLSILREKRRTFRPFLFLVAGLVSFLAGFASSQAKGWTPDNLPMVHLQDARRYVCNPDGVLSAGAVTRSDTLLAALEKEKGVQTVVVVVKHLEGDDPYEFGMALGRKYGIGNKKSSGLIVILATEDRSYQILTGRGMEGTLPDAICRRVQNKVMVPRLKEGNWDEAIVETLEALAGYIRGDASLLNDGSDEMDEGEVWIAALVIIGFLVAFVLFIYYSSYKVCPQCKKRKLCLVSYRTLIVNKRPVRRQTWRCKSCGYTETKDEEDTNPNHRNGGGTGMFIPPIFMGGGRGGGGGFSGGSFGGGSFGGGGSGGRF